jgi:hypothetical protein
MMAAAIRIGALLPPSPASGEGARAGDSVGLEPE